MTPRNNKEAVLVRRYEALIERLTQDGHPPQNIRCQIVQYKRMLKIILENNPEVDTNVMLRSKYTETEAAAEFRPGWLRSLCCVCENYTTCGDQCRSLCNDFKPIKNKSDKRREE